MWVTLFVTAATGCACGRREERLFLGSDHFVSIQHMVRTIRFASAKVYLGKNGSERDDGKPDLEVSDPVTLREFRSALLDAQYDGPDLRWFRPGWAYAGALDGHDMTVALRLSSPTEAGEDSVVVNVHGGRFSFGREGFGQDSFQSPRLARLIRDRLLPPAANDGVTRTLGYLEQGVFWEQEWSRLPSEAPSPLCQGRSGSNAPKAVPPDRPLGSDHFLSMQHLIGAVTLAKARVYLGMDCGGEVAYGKPYVEVSKADVLEELRLALLESDYAGPDLARVGPDCAYRDMGDGQYLRMFLEFAALTPSGEGSFFISVHGSRFSMERGLWQDSFQSPRLARLIRNRLLPKKAPDILKQTLQDLGRDQTKSL